MKWTITLSGTKTEAKHAAREQADNEIDAGNMTPGQKKAVLAAIEALEGPNVSGTISSPADSSTGSEIVLKDVRSHKGKEKS